MKKILYLLILVIMVALSFEVFFINTARTSIEMNKSHQQAGVQKPIKYKSIPIESYIEELKFKRDLNITKILYQDLTYDISLEYITNFSEIVSFFGYISNNEYCRLGSYSIMSQEDNYYKLIVDLSFTRNVVIE